MRSRKKSGGGSGVPGPRSPQPAFAGPPEITGRPAPLLLAGLSLLLTLPIFEPNAIWPLAYCAFVPWLLAMVLARRRLWMHGLSFVFLLAFWLIHGRFLAAVSLEGHCLYSLCLAAQGALGAWIVPHLCRRRRLCLTLVFPVLWTGTELFRSLGVVSSTWFYLAHSQVRLPVMMQIADLVGSLGVTFVVALVNGWLADLILGLLTLNRSSLASHSLNNAPRPRKRAFMTWANSLVSVLRTRRLSWSTAIVAAVLGFSGVYGAVRMRQAARAGGPRVAVIQGDFTLVPGESGSGGDRSLGQRPPPDDPIDQLLRNTGAALEADKRLLYLDLLDRAAAESPDLLVLPEAPWNMILNREYREWPPVIRQARMRLHHEEFVRLAGQYHAPILVTAKSQIPQPPGAYPQTISHNSSFLYRPGQGEPERRDKIGLMLLGEYLPFRDSERLHPIYRWLNDSYWNPWGRGGKEYIDDPGTEYTVFAIPRRGEGGAWRFATAICYEDAIPWLYRRFVVGPDGRKLVDFMVTMSNAGCFGHSTQQPQHLAVSAFRAVENRVGIARAANTGVSGFIRSDGTWYDLAGPSGDQPQAGGLGYRIAEVPCDSRVTVYSRYGDVTAWICLLLAGAGLIDTVVVWAQRGIAPAGR